MTSRNDTMHDMQQDRKWFEGDLLERFVRYAKMHTTSDRHATAPPSSAGQLDLARVLAGELEHMGLEQVRLDDTCFLTATLPGTVPGPCVAFMAHLDTSPEESGESVNPRIHARYDGGPIVLDERHTLDPADYPLLKDYAGETVVTTDGTTLLGADDKAGVAEIMTAVRWLVEHPDVPRPRVEVIFTPDEEVGLGMSHFPRDRVTAEVCYTLDGSDEGSVEAECFTAFRATVTFTGRSIHPGTARGKLANAAAMAAHFVALLPRSESPEATDGPYGFYCPTEISGGIATATATVIVRDFEMETVRRRISHINTLARAIEGAFPGGAVEVAVEKQYLNMAEFLSDRPEFVENAMAAVRETGIEPRLLQIRGGTDGARLSEMGIPCPNIFTGGQNFHGRYEWIALPAMVRASKSIINLVQLFSQST